MRIYTRADLNELPWPATADGDYARRLLVPWIRNGTLAYFHNVDAEIQILETDGQIFPLVLGNFAPRVKNSYVASPMSHYVDYSRAEMRIELQAYPLMRVALGPLVDGLELFFAATRLEGVVLVNNWLLSTNLYPAFETARLADITELLRETYPKRIIVFRSVNTALNGRIYDQLASLDYEPVFSRQVYILDPAKKTYAGKKSYKHDLRIQRRSPYLWESPKDLSQAEIAHLQALYNELYLSKYSHLNPQFSMRFLEEALAAEWLHFEWLRHPDKALPDAMIGWFERDGVMTAPLVGYDRSLPERLGLFRLATLRLVQESIRSGHILHQSSGVSKYKMHRGAEPAMEYNMVYARHCPAWRRWPWQTLRLLTERLLEPMMTKLGL